MSRIINNIRYHRLLLILISSSFFSCAYFNTFYNAETSYKKALKIIEESPALEEEVFPEQAKKFLREAIDNSKMVLQKFPESKYVDDALFIIAKSSFLRDEAAIAESYFIQLIREFPESNFFSLSEIWLAYTHLRMDMVEIARDEMAVITHRKNNNKEELYLINNVLAEIAALDGKTNEVMEFYEKAAEHASSKSKKVAMFSKLVVIADKKKDKEKASSYLLKLANVAPENIRVDARMKWIEYQRELGNYDDVISEIQRLLGLTEFSLEFMRLELELGKVYQSRGDAELSKEMFGIMIEKYPNKKVDEIAEVNYLLGIMALREDFNIDLSREYFEKSKSSKPASFYGRASKGLLSKISHYETLLDLYDEAQNLGKTDSLRNDIENDSNKKKETKIGKNDNKNRELNQPSITSPGEPDSLLFLIGEMLLYDFNSLELSLENMENLIKKYPDSKFAPQSLYVLSYYNPDGSWEDSLKINYPTSTFIEQPDSVIVNVVKEIDLERKRDKAWSLADKSYTESYEEFHKIYSTFQDTLSAYIIGYISDYYLNDMKKAVRHYQSFLDSFPDHYQISKVEDRLKAIETDLEYQKSMTQQALDYRIAVDYLHESKDFDSTKTILDKITKGEKSHYKESAKELKKVIVDYQRISDDYNSFISTLKADTSIIDDSISVKGDMGTLDSLIYNLAKVFHHELEFTDSAEYYYKEIVFSFKESQYRPNAIVALSNLNVSGKWMELLLQDYPDSTISQDTITAPSKYNKDILEEDFITNQDEMINSIETYLNYFSTQSDTIENVEDSVKIITHEDNDSIPSLLKNISSSDSSLILIDSSINIVNLENKRDSSNNLVNIDTVEIQNNNLDLDSLQNINLEEIIDSVWYDHIVRKGETLYSIAKNVFGSSNYWPNIYNWNQEIIDDKSYQIMPYQVLQIKTKSTEIPIIEKISSIYIVQDGETLWDIAKNIYNDPLAWKLIVFDNLQVLNEPDKISINQELTIRKEL